MHLKRPELRPANPCFSSGPCSKPPGWNLNWLEEAVLGRSHRGKAGRGKLRHAIALTREVLEIPDNFRIGIVPASDTGAMEMAMWSLLGERPVELLAWESFGKDWVADVTSQLRIPCRTHEAEYGRLPDLASVNFSADVVFAWNGTTSGVRVPNGGFIPSSRQGLTICDATSAAFAVRLPWDKLDVTTYSWQKVLGGEAAHGILVLSPRAVERVESFTPTWPLPKIFRIRTDDGKINEAIFDGATINTPSMLCVEDYIQALNWARSIGGLEALVSRADANAKVLESFVQRNDWIDFLSRIPETRSNTSVCLVFQEDAIPESTAGRLAKAMASRLEAEGVAYDVGSYRAAPPGLRIWCGATVETGDLERLVQWVEWAFHMERSELK